MRRCLVTPRWVEPVETTSGYPYRVLTQTPAVGRHKSFQVEVYEKSKFLKSIETALEGAKFHEDRAFMFAYLSNKKVSNESYKAIVYHLRAYF